MIRYHRIARRVLKQMKKFSYMPDVRLQQQTKILREKIEKGKTLDQLLVEAYATVCEANRRVLGLSPYFSQVVGAVILHEGNIAEMKTGEGKTLTATMPLYLHGLTGRGNFLITANAYLAKRDASEIGRVYRFLGLTVEVGVNAEGEDDSQRNREKIYDADIVYTTHSGLGFDYLFDNLAASPDKQYLPDLKFAIIDEIDSILLDQAQTPLIVSGAPRVQSNLYETSERLVHQLNIHVDIKRSEDTKSVWLTDEGIQKIESYLGVNNILSNENADLYRHVMIALKANYLFTKNRDYVVDKDQVILLDKMNGRKLIGTKLQSGLHQALEAKEHVKVTDETRAMASITYQNLFRLFRKLSGMTGTAKTDANEFRDTYGLNTVVVPTHRKMIRKDHSDHVYVTNQAKIEASLSLLKKEHNKKRPILIETGSVSMSELYSRILLLEGYPHNVLNATSSAKETRIIAIAGEEGAITVATAMAGRGTDIKLSDAAKKSGGLLVIGTERMSSARIDNQLRGRAGRQGEPGDSIFFVSLEDKVIVENSPEWVKKFRKKSIQLNSFVKKNSPITKKKFKKVVDHAQSVQKNAEETERMQTLEFDEVMKIQRNTLYETRDKIMRANSVDKWILQAVKLAVSNFVNQVETDEEVVNFVYNNIDYAFVLQSNPLPDQWQKKRKKLIKYIMLLFNTRWEIVKNRLSNSDQLLFYKKLVLLKSLDVMWIEQVDTLQQLKSIVSDRNWGQHNPIYEYQDEARKSFGKMKKEVYHLVLKNLLLSEIVYKKDGTIELIFP